MRALIAALLLAAVLAPAALAKELTSVVVIGPDGPPMIEPYRLVAPALARVGSVGPPAEPFVLVFPLRRGVPARPGRWYPRAGILCSGWRSGIEAGCVSAPALRGYLGSGIATGTFTRHPARLVRLARAGHPLLAYGNEAVAVELALLQQPRVTGLAPGTHPRACVAFTATWTGPNAATRPTSFCVPASGGLYADKLVFPLPRQAASLLIG